MNSEQEIRQIYTGWFKGTAAKDIDAVMANVAPNVISYEHDSPLQYVGIDAVREVCQHGFDVSDGELEWDIPDLQILVRDDVAISWGLNHMQVRQPDGTTIDGYSRGTRIFQKLNGQWQMIHQHVSYPYDLNTGQAKTDLKP
ncbi:nuclear transport factor 2 family protein [Spirosoma sp. BT702]|uniref:Nuclear transport factor 2 family protein n=1 Tax=Spirosoma profusum TaxID=2771354 RepID=A0A926Y326_9BACT|nr:nuclear transport factor 2 family protein [Spirosoma profusum]MBD2701465.1 nuclear transport factor 2 family protein [Spirosoma profusum]